MSTTKKYAEENYMSNRLGIPAHDFIKNEYDVNGNLIKVDFYYGGQQDLGVLVATLVMVYDADDNLLTTERTV